MVKFHWENQISFQLGGGKGGGEGKKQKTRIQNNTLPFRWFCFNEHMHESYLMHNYKSMKYLML